ncbi:hypothetical protein [Geothrix sp. PMB-07]|uniref:hypothetical protein n=1 Tax=Geothrix sp. PMB-07 TaxID=3068640 RepID=UPI0027408914|nr:hypothetical protein [Geothrix sp. PMB-07]WLT33474.1 hypothetical protein Q9293_09060 [Geothrix sp. PMB-07]
MEKQDGKKKLSLNKETLKSLTQKEEGEVAAGGLSYFVCRTDYCGTKGRSCWC